MTIPMVDLRPMLAATEPAWRANLERLFERSQFILGEQVDAFERELAAAWGARFAVAAGSGTAAIELGIRAAGLAESGAEVVVPALTSPFTAQAILAAGCRPRFADVDPETLLLDAEDAEARVRKRTGALLPVHLYGQPCDLPRLAAVARRRGLVLLQDACQAHGAQEAGRPFTSFSPAVAYSFYPTKNLPCLGDGGAVLTDSRTVAEKLRRLRDGGRRNDQVARMRAINSRLDEIEACYLRAFLPKLPSGTSAARGWRLFTTKPWPGAMASGQWAGGRVRCAISTWCGQPGATGLRKFLAERGVITGVHYPVPLHLQPAFRDCGLKRGALPVAEQACREVLSLPLWPYMPETAVEEVAARVREFYSAA